MPNLKNYYITTPIYYVNDSPHIGHAYTSLACDVLARFKRLDGYQVHFLTGTDEHGQKIEKAAEKNEKDPQDFVDEVSLRFRKLSKIMNFSNDDFIRTTEPRHKKVVAQLWQKLIDSGDIYLGKYSGWYSVRDEAFYAESELVDGKAPTGADVEWVEEDSYFFKLSRWQDKLLEYYEEHPEFIAPHSRRNEVISFVKGGLEDLSVSRTSFSWGIPVPQNEKHVIYVWLDALTNYISAVCKDDDLSTFKEIGFWPADLHVVGKDILRVHAVYWPAFLMAAELPLPKRVFAHGWWTNEGQKISKSLGNTIDPVKLVEDFGVDYVRYFLMREVPFGNDGNYSQPSFINRINAELANNIGNLSQRTLALIYKNCEGKIPQAGPLQAADKALLSGVAALLDRISLHMEIQAIHLALGEIVELASKANEYIDTMAPWQLAKTDKERMATVLYVLAEVIRILGAALQPFTPELAAKLLAQLNIDGAYNFSQANIAGALKAGTQIPEPKPVMMRLG
jgi:methionyl-tRNA synthetase